MKIWSSLKPHKASGPHIFAKHLEDGLRDKGIDVTYDIEDDYDLMLIIATYDMFFNKKIKEKKNEGVKIVQRLNGVYTFGTSNIFYPLRNFGMKYVLHNLADYIIYQSEYSKFLCDKYLGKPNREWSIIYNGVDFNLFNPEGERYNYDAQYTLFCITDFGRGVTFYPLIKAMTYLKEELSDVQLVLAGPMNSRYKQTLENKPYIKYIGRIPNNEVPLYEREADCFIYSIRGAGDWTLIEAMACGLPIACYDIGCNRELIGNNEAGILADSGIEKYLWKYFMLLPNSKNLANAVIKVLENRERYSSQARKRTVKYFSVDKMVNEYVKVFEKVLERD